MPKTGNSSNYNTAHCQPAAHCFLPTAHFLTYCPLPTASFFSARCRSRYVGTSTRTKGTSTRPCRSKSIHTDLSPISTAHCFLFLASGFLTALLPHWRRKGIEARDQGSCKQASSAVRPEPVRGCNVTPKHRTQTRKCRCSRVV